MEANLSHSLASAFQTCFICVVAGTSHFTSGMRLIPKLDMHWRTGQMDGSKTPWEAKQLQSDLNGRLLLMNMSGELWISLFLSPFRLTQSSKGLFGNQTWVAVLVLVMIHKHYITTCKYNSFAEVWQAVTSLHLLSCSTFVYGWGQGTLDHHWWRSSSWLPLDSWCHSWRQKELQAVYLDCSGASVMLALLVTKGSP